MTEEGSDVMNTARLWMLRVNDPDFKRWDDLAHWLEADARHLAAYEAALDEDAWVADLKIADTPSSPLRMASPLPAPARPRRRTWLALGGAVAAALAALGTWTITNMQDQAVQIATAPGEHRSIALSDGSRVQLNGDTVVKYDPENPRMAILEHGEAVFEVHHDSARPFVVTVGDIRLIDAGTVFNVVHEAGTLEVAVAEGAVIYDARDEPIRLEPGDSLVRSAPGAKPELRRADPTTVGGWREGLLQYDDAELSVVARDLSRTLGQSVRLAAGGGMRRYSGTLAVSGPAQDVLNRVGPLLGVTFRQSGDGWEMIPDDGAIR